MYFGGLRRGDAKRDGAEDLAVRLREENDRMREELRSGDGAWVPRVDAFDETCRNCCHSDAADQCLLVGPCCWAPEKP